MQRIVLAILPALAFTVAGAAELPQRKPGLWVITSKSADGSAFESKACLDAKTNAAYDHFNLTAGAEKCSKKDVTQAGSRTTIDSVCSMGGHTVTSHSVISWSGDAAYHIDSTGHWDPPMMGKADTTSSQDAKWTGACPADMKPGDMVMPGGMKMNLPALAAGQ
jgi:hypothetical protein